MTPDYDNLFRLAGIMAAERTRTNPDMFEDVRQEAMIAGWKAAEAAPDKPIQYVHAAMRNGAANLLRGRPASGSAGHQGRPDAHDRASSLTLVNEDVRDAVSEGLLDAVEVASDVRQAMLQLDDADREIAFGRYWLDETFSDLAERTNRKTGTLSRRWIENVRPALAETLAA